jgi:dUTP pyrophosphatase
MIKYYTSGNYDPKVATDGAAGFDLYVNAVIQQGDISTIHTGVHVEIPSGWVGLLIPRSSWGEQGWTLANTVGVIDSDYRGEILVKAKRDTAKGWKTIRPGDRIVQLVVVRCDAAAKKVDSLKSLTVTARGAGAFGSTGGA